MEFLDEQGRLLGVVNIVDALVAVFVLTAAIAGAVLVTSGSDPQANAAGSETPVGKAAPADDIPPNETVTTTTIDLSVSNLHPAKADVLATGLTDEAATSPAEITALSSEPARIVKTAANGTLVVSEHPWNRDVTLTLTVDATRTDDHLAFRGDPLRIGEQRSFDFGNVSVTGTVVDVRTEKPP